MVNEDEEGSTRENVEIEKDLRKILVTIDKIFNRAIARL